MTPIFLLGVGAQKGGTTWLYQYLKRHPECNMGLIKELAIWGAHYRPDLFQTVRRSKTAGLKALAEAFASPPVPPKKRARLLAHLDALAIELDPGRYMEYFTRLVTGGARLTDTPLRARLTDTPLRARLTGDISPNYAALKGAHFAEIRARIVAGGFTPKVVFLMRDPISRAYSAMKMADRNAGAAATAHLRFVEDAKRDWCQIRTRYEHTIPALEAAFAPDEIYYEFFESFFDQAQLDRLTAFLGIAPLDGKLDHVANASPSTHAPPPEAIAEIRAFYGATYEFAMDRFGEEKIRAIWKHA